MNGHQAKSTPGISTLLHPWSQELVGRVTTDGGVTGDVTERST